MLIFVAVKGIIIGLICNNAFLKSYCSNKKTVYIWLNTCVYVWIHLLYGATVETFLYCLMSSILLPVSIIDYHFYKIPARCNYALFILGIIHSFVQQKNMVSCIAGFVCVSVFLLLFFLFSGGKLIGGGDVKFMAVCGLFLGAEQIFYAFYVACVMVVVVCVWNLLHKNVKRKIAMGPYFSVGIWVIISIRF